MLISADWPSCSWTYSLDGLSKTPVEFAQALSLMS